MYFAKLENNTVLRAYDKGADIQIIFNGDVKNQRWFSIHTSIDESFINASKRVINKLSIELKSSVKIQFVSEGE